jgi:AcrR family transcriptional regulator
MPTAAPTVPQRRTQNAEATRQALVRVAERLFATHGYAAVSIDEICRRARVTKGALYHHFADKRDLFRNVYEDFEDRWIDEMVAGVANVRDPLRRFELGCAAFLDACLEPAAQRILLLDGPSVLGLDELRGIDHRRGLALIANGLGDAMAAGTLERQPVEPVAHLILGALNEASFAIAHAADPGGARKVMGSALARMIDGLRPRGAHT